MRRKRRSPDRAVAYRKLIQARHRKGVIFAVSTVLVLVSVAFAFRYLIH